MANFIEMITYSDGTNFLKKHMFSKSLSSDKTKMTIKWNCWPQAVPYSYSYSGKKKTGYYSGGTASSPGGIYRSDDLSKKITRKGIFEGVKTVSIKYRKNGGTWTTITPDSYDSHIIKLSSKKNGDKFEIKVTYALCTMGFPHRWYPFMWFGNQDQVPKKYKKTKSGKSKYFTDAKPYFPGTSYPCVPEAWKPESPYSYTWTEPESKKNWSKIYGKEEQDYSTWVSKYSCEYNTKHLSTESWTSEAGNVPQLTRKSSYFIYHRTFTDSFTTSDILERPLPIVDPDKPIVECVPAHGESGIVKVSYNHSGGEDGTIVLYGSQKILDKPIGLLTPQVITGKVAEADAIDGSTVQFNVNFVETGFVRSKDIRYYAVAKVYDEEYKTYRTAASCEKDYDKMAQGHYFNEEPPAVTPSLIDSLDTTQTARVVFDKVDDPDGDSVSYVTYIQSEYDENNTNEKQFFGGVIDGVKGVDGVQKYALEMDQVSTSYVDIDMTPYEDREKIKVWIESTDNYENSYYYSSKPVEIIKTKSPSVSIKVEPAHGEKGTLTLTYRHDKGAGGTVELTSYQSDDSSAISGQFKSTIKKFEVESLSTTTYLEKTWTVDIDFKKQGFTRSRMIGYWAVATDEDGKKSSTEAPDWLDIPKGHYYNEEPPPVTPSVNQDLLVSKEIAYLSWNESIDPDGDNTTYELFVYDGTNKEQEIFTGPGASGTLWYTKKFTTKDTKYNFSVKDYDNEKLSAWIRTRDEYENSYYYTGNILEFANQGLAPYKPLVTTVPAHEEKGDLYINYSHPTGRSGDIYLYAIGEYKDGTRKLVNVFEKIQTTNNKYVTLSSGVNQPYVIDFRKLFGNEPENRSCEIRYYAVAYTVGFDNVSSESEDWEPSTDLFNKWVTGHYYNEEPAAPVITLNEDKTDLHHNAYISWNKITDPDGDIAKFYVYLNAKTDPNKKEDQFFVGSREDKYLSYTKEYITENNYLNISLDDFADDEEFELWIKSTDGYPNSYYYCSDILTFKKLTYHRPNVIVSLNNVHGENGELTVKYSHPDYGQEDRDDFSGKVTIHAYVNDVYAQTILEDIDFEHNETKVFNIDFASISNKRSKYISYFVVAEDNVAHLLSSDTNSHFASSSERFGTDEDANRHYYNEEPTRVFPTTGQPDNDEDRPFYMFDYLNIEWDEATDQDNDDIFYNVYIKSIDANEPIYNLDRPFNFSDEDINKGFNRLYQIRYNSGTNTYETYRFNFESNEYIKEDKRDSSKLGFRITYKDTEEGWPEPEEWKGKYGELWVETTDGYENSYYRCSPIYTFTRQKHEPPNKVLLQCETAHGEKGNISITYTHPEDLNGEVYLYAYQEGIYKTLIDTVQMKSGTTETIEINFINNFDRSTNISYYAIAADTIGIGLKSDDREPEDISIEEHATGHYFNDEPPAVNIQLVEDFTPFNTVRVKWDLVDDPDRDDVTYYIYLKCSTSGLNKNQDYFYGDGQDREIESEGEEHEGENKSSIGYIDYYNVYKITPQMQSSQNYNEGFDINIESFAEDERLELWIQTRDDYENSYYWSGDILVFDKGHSALPIKQAYPRTNTIVYAKTPRIVIELNEDSFEQEVLVKWGSTTYSNKEHREYFSDGPHSTTYSNKENADGTYSSVANPHYVVFRPPTPYTTKHNSKVPYSVKVNNTCSTSEEVFYSYIYRNFLNDFSDTKFIPLKSNHLNTFKEAVNDVRDAYGFETVQYNRNIQKDMILDNEDYNSVDSALKDVNDFINNADPTIDLDDSRTYINLEDGAIVGYDSETDTDFTEWQVLLDLLENM